MTSLKTETELLREALQDTTKRLAEAEAALCYYADCKNYRLVESTPVVSVYNLLVDDFYKLYGSLLGGRRAREYLIKYNILFTL